MSRWNEYGWYAKTPKKPPPKRGIRMKKAGTTWWGQRWIEALTFVLEGDSGRLARGRTYARAGRTHDLVVERGTVTAKVTGSRAAPYEIQIDLAQLGDAIWKKAIQGMASKAHFAAELLQGQMPQQIDEVFREAGASLFPKTRADLETDCSCPDWGDPCKHVAATHYVLGEALDRDPFLLFELRGRTKEQVLDALRAARGGTSSKQKAVEVHAIPSVKLGKLTEADYDRPTAALPSLSFSFDEPTAHGAVLRQLGAPAAWGSEATPADVLTPLVRAAAEKARRLALAEPEDASDSPAPPRAAKRRVPKKRARKR